MKYQKMIKTALIPLILLASISAQAGKGVGSHGGSAVTCFKTQDVANYVRKVLEENARTQYPVDPFTDGVLKDIKSIELLDLYNYEKYSGKVYSDPRMNEEAMFESYRDRMTALKETNWIFHSILEEKSNGVLKFQPETWRKATSGVVALFDAKIPIILDNNCLPIQIAYQTIVSPGLAYVYYDVRLFELLDAANRAALLVHERLYNYFVLTQQATDSVNTQLAVGEVFAADLGRKKSEQVLEKMKNLDMRTTLEGTPKNSIDVILPDETKIDCRGNLEARPNAKLRCALGYSSHPDLTYLKQLVNFEFDPTRSLIEQVDELALERIVIGDARIESPRFKVSVSEGGNKSMYVAFASSQYTGFDRNGYSSSAVSYYPNGVIAQETINYITWGTAKVKIDGHKVRSGQTIRRNEAGKVIEIDGRAVN